MFRASGWGFEIISHDKSRLVQAVRWRVILNMSGLTLDIVVMMYKALLKSNDGYVFCAYIFHDVSSVNA